MPPNPKAGFDGIVVHCQVLECEPPSRLVFSWSAGGPVVNTRVSYRLEPDGDGTRFLFEHSGFDGSQPWGDQAIQGTEFGWEKMLEQLPAVVAGLAGRKDGWEPLKVQIPSTVAFATVDGISVYERVGATGHR